jgi:ABC-type transport system involved in multi-copper enzyme maturation permease subunit
MEAGTVPDKVTISHRGAKYEIGRAKRFYGIWVSGAPASDPIDRWPETREGWEQAWTRFIAVETPASITAVEQPRGRLRLPRLKLRSAPASRAGRPVRMLAGAGLLALGVVLGVIGLFPGYVGSPSLASQADQLVPHLLYLVTWAVSAALVALGVRSRSAGASIGALLGTGLSAVTFGLFFADLGQVIAGGSSLLGAGLLLSLFGWLACAAGSVLALTAAPAGRPLPGAPLPGAPLPGAPESVRGYAAVGGPSRPRAADAGAMALLLLAAVGTVAAFAPSWDSYTLSQASTGAAETITAGNAFANPGAVIAGNVIVMIAVIGVALLAALWRPARHGAVLLAGAIVPLAAQAISALIQAGEPATPGMFGISSSQAAASGLTISSGLTPIFWVYCVFVISLLISCAWMLTAPHHPAMPAAQRPPEPGPAGPAQSEPGEADDTDGGEEHEESSYAGGSS